MWLFTKDGFFSAVQDREDADAVMVRARVREDLTKFIERAYGPDTKGTSPEIPTIIETTDSDYRFRVIIDRIRFQSYAEKMINDLDYFNFKSEVHGDLSRDKAYMRCWSAMNDLQQDHVESKGDYIGGRFIG